jgi:hypothetical protein
MQDIEEGDLHCMMEAGSSPIAPASSGPCGEPVLRGLSSSERRLKPPSARDGGRRVRERRAS